MVELHSSLTSLAPREYADVPLDNLSEFLRESFDEAEVIINSIPPPPPASTDESDAPYVAATSAAEVKPSKHRLHSVHPDHESLQSKWGKPLKLGTKENPAGVTMYKMAANDRNGAWFGRRSVHDGVSFDKWKKAMQSEFKESLAISGGPGAGSIRGIGADRLLERKSVPGLGKLEVYQLSAQFPGPTAPRDFVILLLTTDAGLSEKSANHAGENKIGQHIPRHYMVVSIPVDHPDAPVRQGLVRGRYESVEMIREVSPSSTLLKDPHKLNEAVGSKTSETKDGATSEPDNASGEQSYPVEWSMITRSDPGGGIPRFMVERGTPGSIAGDANKFLGWVTSKEEFLQDEEENDIDVDASQKVDRLEILNNTRRLSDSASYEPSQPTDTGIIASLTSVVRDGIDRYVPDSVQNGISNLLPGEMVDRNTALSDDSSEVSSLNSWASAEQYTTASGVPQTPLKQKPEVSSSTTSIVSEAGSDKANNSRQRLDKELSKLESKRKRLDQKFAKAKEKEEAKASEQINKDKKDETKIQQRLEKDKAKHEERYNRELKKLEDKRKQEEAKAAERKKRADDGDAVARITRERDQARRMAEVLRKENEIWRERVGDLQKENTLLVARVSRLDGGHSIIKDVQHEMAESASNSKKAASQITIDSKSTKEGSSAS